MKRKINFIAIIIFLLFTGIVKSQDKDDCTLWLGVSWNPIRVSNLPLYLREVPYYRGAGGVLDNTSYHMSFYFPFELRFLILNSNFGISYGVGTEITLLDTHLFEKDRYKYGGTTIFDGIIMLGPISSVGVKPLAPFVSLNPNVFMEIPISRKDAKNVCNLHVSVGYQALAMVSGWETRHSDGNQTLKYHEKKILAYLFPLNIGLQFNILGIDFEAGPDILLSVQTKAGKDCDIKTNAVGLSVKLRMPEN